MRYIDLLENTDNQLRDYQIKHKRDIYEAWDEGCRSIMLQMPTGTGKTHLFVSIIKDLQKYSEDCRILVLAHREEILSQICDTLYNKYKVSCGKIDKINRSVEHNNILVASVQTMVNRLYKHDYNFDLIVVDEAHHTKAKSYKYIIEKFPTAKVLGVTATPYRLSGEGFWKEYDKLILSATIEEYIRQGVLSNIKYLPTNVVIQDCNSITIGADGDYKKEILFRCMNNPLVNTSIIDAYKRYAKDKKGIVYTINQEHNTILKNHFVSEGVESEAIDSKTQLEERKKIINDFKKGDVKVLCNVDIFGEGFDCPDVDFILLARPTKSLSLYLQQVGRGLRKTDNKDSVLIIDCVGSYTRFGLPTKERDWLKHFEGEGKEIDYSPTSEERLKISKIREDYGLSAEIKELEQFEDLSHLKDFFVIKNSGHSFENEFKEYYESFRKKGFGFGWDLKSIQRWINGIKKIDRYIRVHINADFGSIFYTIDYDLIHSFEQKLRNIVSFVRYNASLHNDLKKALERYKDYARHNHKIEDKKIEQEKKDEILNDILARRDGDISKSDIEITVATLKKLGVSNLDRLDIKNVLQILMSRYERL